MASEKTAIPLDMEKESISPEITGTAPEEVLKHSNDADEAMKAFAGHDGEVLVLDEATNKRLLRKIDTNLMPVCPHPDIRPDDTDNTGTASLRHLWSQLLGQYDQSHTVKSREADKCSRDYSLLCQCHGNQKGHSPQGR